METAEVPTTAFRPPPITPVKEPTLPPHDVPPETPMVTEPLGTPRMRPSAQPERVQVIACKSQMKRGNTVSGNRKLVMRNLRISVLSPLSKRISICLSRWRRVVYEYTLLIGRRPWNDVVLRLSTIYALASRFVVFWWRRIPDRREIEHRQIAMSQFVENLEDLLPKTYVGTFDTFVEDLFKNESALSNPLVGLNLKLAEATKDASDAISDTFAAATSQMPGRMGSGTSMREDLEKDADK
eukprot:GHVO01040274.1.p1 GENE.GHVO01040274.1~~GHVO01040274.1.p1  ORF type:complete len:240 (-),score=35.30 GHVO01040274.1:138-857(-)